MLLGYFTLDHFVAVSAGVVGIAMAILLIVNREAFANASAVAQRRLSAGWDGSGKKRALPPRRQPQPAQGRQGQLHRRGATLERLIRR